MEANHLTLVPTYSDFYFIVNHEKEEDKITAHDQEILQAWNTEISAETELKVIGFEPPIT